MQRIRTDAPLIGRAEELERLRARFADAAASRASAVLVAGEAGIGKSRLVREFADGLEGRADVLLGRCVDLGRAATPYGPLVEVLRALVAVRGAERVWRAAGPSRASLLLLLSELAEVAAREDPSGGGEVPEAPRGADRLHEAVAMVLADSGELPVVAVIEDLHWADEGTLTLLTALLRLVDAAPLLLVLTMRDDGHRSDPARRFAVEAERARVLERVALSRLGEADVRILAETLRGEPLGAAAFDRLSERSEGIPFFIEELLEGTTGPLADSLRDLMLARYDRLGPDAGALVRTMSVSRSCLSHDELRELAAQAGPSRGGAASEAQAGAEVGAAGPDPVDAALREALDAGVLVLDDAGEFMFRHALLREAVQGELLPGERIGLHRRLAEILERSRAADPSLDLAPALAYHWQGANEPERALAAAALAMEQAKRRYAFAAAARFGEQVLDLWGRAADPERIVGADRPAFLGRFASIVRNAGENRRSLAIVDQALRELGPDAPRASHARLLRDRALYLSNAGMPGEQEILRDALEVLGDAPDEEPLRGSLLNFLASATMRAGDVEPAIGIARRALAQAELAGDTTQQSIAFNLIGTCSGHLGRAEEGAEAFAAARELMEDANAALRYFINFSDSLNLIGRYRDAVQAAEEGLDVARRHGVLRTTGRILTQNLVEPLLELGEIERVEEVLRPVPDLGSILVRHTHVVATGVRALAWRGRTEEAAALFAEWSEHLRAAGELERQVWYALVHIRAELAISGADFDAAADLFTGMIADDGHWLAYQRRILMDAAWTAAELRAAGRPREEYARRVAEDWRAQPEAVQDPHCSAVVLALLDPDRDPDRLRAAVAATEHEVVPRVFGAIARLELSRALVSAGDREAAAEQAAAAVEAAEGLGHATVLRLARAHAEAVGGASPRRSGAGDPEALTAREEQVLALVAEGLSNREIGGRLFISAKTVSVHVSAILRKLGASSRTEAAALSRRGLDAGGEGAAD